MKQCDVLVVGAGPAGSSLAWGLRDSGMDVLIMDRKTFPRDKVCAGWITPAVMETLRIDTQEYRKEHVLEPIRGFRIGVIGGDTIEIAYGGKPVSYGIRRIEFDHYLLRRSTARFLPGTAFANMQRRGQTWIVNNEIQTPLVVGAGGHFCPIARSIGAGTEPADIKVVAREMETRLSPRQSLSCEARPDTPELYFCTDFRGYGWLFRKGDYLNIGLGREDPENLPGHTGDFLDFLRRLGKIPQDLSGKFNGHAYCLYHHCRRQLCGDGVLLIGDAAGLACTQSGEGILPAVESGIMAAQVISGAGSHYDKDSLQPYAEGIRKRYGARRDRDAITAYLPAWIKDRLAGRLLATRWFAGNVVMNRWFLHSDQAVLRL